MAKKQSSDQIVVQILNSAFKRKQKSNPSYSMRALARDLGVSAAFVSNMMKGVRLPPKERLDEISRVLELDLHEREKLVAAAVTGAFGSEAVGKLGKGPSKLSERKTSEAGSKDLLSSWRNLAVLEGVTLASPFNNPESLRERLGISPAQFATTIETLLGLGLIRETGDGYEKADDHLYVAGGRSRKEVRQFHEMMIAKATNELTTRTGDEDFRRRLINGFTFGLNTENLERLKLKIVEFMDEISREASSGPCSDVYQMNLQFFPLTSRKPDSK